MIYLSNTTEKLSLNLLSGLEKINKDTFNGIIENIDKAREPLYTSKPELERSGMGFTIMESFMDELNVESVLGVGTKVTMKKKISFTSVGGNSILTIFAVLCFIIFALF